MRRTAAPMPCSTIALTPAPPSRRPESPRRCCGSRCSGKGCPRATPRTSASSGSGLRPTRSTALITMPGVQNPHCSPWCSRKAACIGCSSPFVSRPSMVVTSWPSASSARHVQLLIDWPSSSTQQAPHWLVSHPTWVPVRPSDSRMNSTSNVGAATSPLTDLPLTVIETVGIMPPASLSSCRGRTAAPGSLEERQVCAAPHGIVKGLPCPICLPQEAAGGGGAAVARSRWLLRRLSRIRSYRCSWSPSAPAAPPSRKTPGYVAEGRWPCPR